MSIITVGRFGRGGRVGGSDFSQFPAGKLAIANKNDCVPKLSQSSIRFCTVPGSRGKSKWPNQVTTGVFWERELEFPLFLK